MPWLKIATRVSSIQTGVFGLSRNALDVFPIFGWRNAHSGWDEGDRRRGTSRLLCINSIFHDIIIYCNITFTVLSTVAQYEYDDEPDDKGNVRKRPGKLTDKFPSPYPNEQAARAANNGALPIDLSLITLARKHRNGGEVRIIIALFLFCTRILGFRSDPCFFFQSFLCSIFWVQNYVFHLLTSYVDAPGGVKLQAGQAYNPYFEGGTLGMPQQLFDDMLEFDDGALAE